MRNGKKISETHPSGTVSAESSLSARILQAQDDERRKISRELHDSVGQALVASKMGLAKFKQDQAIPDGSALDKVMEILDSTIAEVRTISHLLHPPDLDLMGLRASLVWFAEGFEQRTGIRTDLDAPKQFPTLPSTVRTALFRIVQECLTNVHRHAGASHVTLRVVVDSNRLQLEVTDNGKGFADLDSCRQGIGILGMQERVAEIGGTLRVESGRGAGSSVFATVPLSHSSPAARLEPVSADASIRVLVVDDHPAIRTGIRTVLSSEPDIVICGEASNAGQAVNLATEVRPDVMILDLQLGGHNGWAVLRELRAAQLTTKVIIFSHYEALVSANSANCDGFVSKGSDNNKLIEAIRTVAAGGKYFGLKVVGQSA